jgi:EmrB/QacA subfamily drug resistance transporter
MLSRKIAVLVLLFATFMELLDVTIITVALPSIEADLDATSSQLEWIVSGYILAFAVLVITGGRLGDIFGRKRIFIIGLMGFTVASAACAFATSADMLVLSRVIQGAFGALMIPQALSIIQVLFSPKERAGVFAALGLVSGLAAVTGPLLGGYLVAENAFDLGWRSVFVINLPVGVILLIAAIIFIPESKSEAKVRLDFLGVLLISSSLFLLVFALIEGRPLSWPIEIFIMMGLSPVLLAIFIWQQKRRDASTGSALVPPSLFKSRGYSAGVIVQLAFGSAIGTFFLILIIYLQVALGFSPLEAGLATLPFSLGALVGSGASVPLVPRLGKYLVLTGSITLIGGYFWITKIVEAQADNLTGRDLVAAMAISGLGLAFVVVPLNDVALAETATTNAGAASGVLGTFTQIGAAIGIAVVGVVFFGTIDDIFLPEIVREAFINGMWVPMGALALAAIASTLLPSVKQVAAQKVAADLIKQVNV